MKIHLHIRLATLALILVFTACRSDKEAVVTISTDLGDIVLVLFDDTPRHKENFLKLAEKGYYNGTTFHRVIDGFMIQGGDPNSKDDDPANDGQGGPGYTLPAEFRAGLTHVKGAVAAARQPDFVNPEKASSGSQFYIVEGDNGAHHLDGDYTVFGRVIKGLEVVEKIAAQPVGEGHRPLQDIVMTMKVTYMSKQEIAEKYGYEME